MIYFNFLLSYKKDIIILKGKGELEMLYSEVIELIDNEIEKQERIRDSASHNGMKYNEATAVIKVLNELKIKIDEGYVYHM